MRTYDPGNGMFTVICKAAAYSRILKGRFQKCLAETLPFLAPILISAVTLIETEGGRVECSAIVHGELHAIDFNHRSLAYCLVVDNPEAVPFLQAEEIHGPGVDIRKIDNQQR